MLTNVDIMLVSFFFFQAEDGIRDLVRSRGLGDVYKRQSVDNSRCDESETIEPKCRLRLLMIFAY